MASIQENVNTTQKYCLLPMHKRSRLAKSQKNIFVLLTPTRTRLNLAVWII